MLIRMSDLFCFLILKLGPEVVFGNSTAVPVKGKSQDAFVVCTLFMVAMIMSWVGDRRELLSFHLSISKSNR